MLCKLSLVLMSRVLTPATLAPIALVSMLMLLGCDMSDESQSKTPGVTTRVRMDGSSTVFPISEAVAEEYHAVAPDVRVTVGVSGTGGGFKKFIAGEIDINDASRSIKHSEQKKAKQAGVGFIEVPVAYDGLSVIVNKNNDWVDYLSLAELHKIWMPGSPVETWSDVRRPWPKEKIRLYGPGTDSGTFDYFTKVVNGEEQASRADFTASENDNVLVQGIAGDLYSLGYFGFAYYIENKSQLKIVPIDGGKGPVVPSLETISKGIYAPLSRPVFIYINPKSLDDPGIMRFVEFYIQHAGSLSQEVGYITLPASVYESAMQRINHRVTGTAYGEEATLTRLIGH